MVAEQIQYRASSVRDENGKWLNSDIFRESGSKFMSSGGFDSGGNYCTDPIESPSWVEFWDRELQRCKEGYIVNGQKITGHHYEYLNYSPIQLVEETEDGSTVSTKETKLPDFWDGDYDYYWCVEIARNGVLNRNSLASTRLEQEVAKELDPVSRQAMAIKVIERLKLKVQPHPDFLEGGNHMIVGKSRRKGYSYKNAAICVNTYNTVRKSVCVIGAFAKGYLYPEGTMGMASEYMSSLNKHTAWGKAREFTNKVDIKTASYKEIHNGVEVESGYQSTVMAVTFKDNPSAARGKDAVYVLLEEAGAFPNLKASFMATAPSLEAGKYVTGQILIFGTGGDMEVGTVDFAEMFYNPIQFGLMPFINIWDKDAENSYCGFFHPVYLNMEGFYDSQGNSDTEAALQDELTKRERIIKASTSSNALQTRVQERPICPSEAFLTVSTNDFPIVELRKQYNKVMKDNLHIRYGQTCSLLRENTDIDSGTLDKEGNPVKRTKVRIIPDLDGFVEPLWNYKPKTKDLRGGVVIYEAPVVNAPKGLYKIGFDPYRQDMSTLAVPSLGVVYVYKTFHRYSQKKNQIVAQFVGRPYDPDSVNRVAEMLAELYNAEIMHENEVTHVKNYFMRKKKLHLLASQPDSVIASVHNNSKTKRVYGIHMTEKLKDAGEKYIKAWLLTERDYDEDGNVLLNLDTIYDPALLEELILYNRKGNFDRVMAFMMVMFQLAEDDENKEYGNNTDQQRVNDLMDFMKKQFTNNATIRNLYDNTIDIRRYFSTAA